MSLEELEKEFKRQKQKINIFISLKENEKIMENKRKGTLYIEPPGYLQIVKRWWYGEDRTTTFNYLDKYFTEFIRFLDSILSFSQRNDEMGIVPLGHLVCNYINAIIPGIHVLKTTYPDYKQLHSKIGSIIVTMIDYKTEFRLSIGSTHLRERAPSF